MHYVYDREKKSNRDFVSCIEQYDWLIQTKTVSQWCFCFAINRSEYQLIEEKISNIANWKYGNFEIQMKYFHIVKSNFCLNEFKTNLNGKCEQVLILIDDENHQTLGFPVRQCDFGKDAMAGKKHKYKRINTSRIAHKM